jgi:3-demethoxyubiquinol 3-hydroxylase
MQRQQRLRDRLLAELDHALRVVVLPAPAPATDASSTQASEGDSGLTPADRRESAALMRVNHAGEIAAQALYRGQALTARDPELRQHLLLAAGEEQDHLAWCEGRLQQLGSHTSRLAPLWYGGSFALGALAGLAGDRHSLSFLAETERQVAAHLEGHLQQLPAADAGSRAIVARMRDDEARHHQQARSQGASELPGPVRAAMTLASRVMTTLAARF